MNIRKMMLAALTALAMAAAFAQQTVQVVMPEDVNLTGSEAAWLPGQIQDKLKSNLQEYLGLRTFVDSASEAKLKQLQRESEDAGRDTNAAIELGKISTAKFAVFARIRKTGRGYTISADYTDLTTGEQKATVTSKEYNSAEELYENTGAIDEITLILAERLHIAVNHVQKQALQYGTADFSIDDQLTLVRQNEEQYKKMISQFDEQLRALSVSNDLSAVENAKKIEAEKALLAEKQKNEQKRLAELAEQKKKAAEDALKEAARTDEQKKRRDELSAQAAAKAAEVRKQKMEKQGVFGQINVIESKKKALVEIRQGVEARIEELRKQAEKDKTDEAEKIRNKAWTSVELENGSPTAEAKQRRENLVAEYTKQRHTKLQEEERQVRNSVDKQDAELLAEIRSDQKKITGLRTVSSMGGELKVSYGAYSGENKGWNAYLSLYSESIVLYQDTFLISYKALTEKDAPDNIAKASDAVMRDYSDTVDMYNSLLLRGDPVLYYEIDYTVSAAPDDEPSKYTFDFKTLRVINTVSGTLAQTIPLGKRLTRTMSPVWDIRSLYLHLYMNLYMSGTMIKGYNPDTLPLNLVIPEGVTSIGNSAFSGCKSLASITIPVSVTSIGDKAFSGCTSLTSITIPDSVTSIGNEAFRGCTSLASITIPASVISIGDKAFSGCKSLVAQFGGTKAQWKKIKGKGDWFSGVHCTDGIIGVAEAPAYLKMEGTKITDCDKNTLPSNLVIPEGVTEIGYSAFRECTSLTSITIPASVTSIGRYAFWSCKSLASVTIGNSVTSIGDDAFGECTSLTSITIPDSVTSIGDSAFYRCDSLASITIPNSVTSIGERTFYGCRSLASITIPDSVTSIDKEAFENCTSLTSVTIGNSVTSIGNEAFRGCTSLASITIPASVTSIGDKAFYGRTSLVVQFGGTKAQWKKIKGESDWFSGVHCTDGIIGVAEAPAYLKMEGTRITGYDKITLPSNLVIPEGVTSIDKYAFLNCRSLASITIPDSVTSIGERAFRGCTSLHVYYAGTKARWKKIKAKDNEDLNNATMHYKSNGDWLSSSVHRTDGIIGVAEAPAYLKMEGTKITGYDKNTLPSNLVIPEGVTAIGDRAFEVCTSLTSVTIGNSVTSIGSWTFRGCTSLTSITIPASVTSIGNGAFYGCTSLASITIPASVTSIGSWAFEECTSLTSITIPASVTSIGDNAFYGCTSLASITIPASVTSIGEDAFWNCTSLVAQFGGTKAQWKKIKGKGIWFSSVHCTDGIIGVAEAPAYLKMAGTRITGYDKNTLPPNLVIPEGVTSIGYSAFRECTSLASITIPASVTSIGSDAFRGCTSLTSITIPASVTSIDSWAFYGCTSLASITIPASVTEIGYSAFAECTSLASITIPDSVTSIGNSAFSGCTSLASITIPDSVTSIDKEAFRDCESLTSVTIGNSVTSIGDNAFYGCKSLHVYYAGTKARWEKIKGKDNKDLDNATMHYESKGPSK